MEGDVEGDAAADVWLAPEGAAEPLSVEVG